MISLVIPTYRNPEYLDICLRSAIENQTNKNEIVVAVDGFIEEKKVDTSELRIHNDLIKKVKSMVGILSVLEDEYDPETIYNSFDQTLIEELDLLDEQDEHEGEL